MGAEPGKQSDIEKMITQAKAWMPQFFKLLDSDASGALPGRSGPSDVLHAHSTLRLGPRAHACWPPQPGMAAQPTACAVAVSRVCSEGGECGRAWWLQAR